MGTKEPFISYNINIIKSLKIITRGPQIGYKDKFFKQLIQDQKIAEQKRQAWSEELGALLETVVDNSSDKNKEAA